MMDDPMQGFEKLGQYSDNLADRDPKSALAILLCRIQTVCNANLIFLSMLRGQHLVETSVVSKNISGFCLQMVLTPPLIPLLKRYYHPLFNMEMAELLNIWICFLAKNRTKDNLAASIANYPCSVCILDAGRIGGVRL